MVKKTWTLEELEDLLGKEQLEKLFLEHYLTLVGKNAKAVNVVDGLLLEDIME